jgi:hypothetical protein
MRAAVVGVAVLLAASASGGIEHTILHGVAVRDVKTWVGPDAIPGLTGDGLKAEVKASLKKAGIALDPKGGAELFVSAMAFLPDSNNCFVTVQGRLIEPAKLDRNGFAVDAISWERGSTVLAKETDCAQPTMKATQGALADFVEHYRAMNPEKGLK